MYSQLISILLLLIEYSLAYKFKKIPIPGIDFDLVGGAVGFLGDYDGLSFYTYQNASSNLIPSHTEDSLFLLNKSDNANLRIASVSGGSIKDVVRLQKDLFLLSGDFDSFNNVLQKGPLTYNISSGHVESILPSDFNKRDSQSLNGTVKTVYVDDDLIYLGGDFSFNGSVGAAVYNWTSKKLLLLPFEGFGKHGIVNSITKLALDNKKEASIIFAGSFDTLGLSDLLLHNISLNSTHSNHSNSTNSSIISAEQVVSLKNGHFSSINLNDDASSIICPSSGNTWKVAPNSGGQWVVQLPSAMSGLTPTKLRLYLPPDSDNGVKTFRLYTYPNNGIMNLTYVDPKTNRLATCDASCPLLKASELSNYVDDNVDNADDLMDDDKNVFVDLDDGSLSMYYDPSTKSKNLGYGANYQEFALVNHVGIDKLGVTVTDWYGQQGELGGLELYLNAILVYGNETLNEPNCDKDDISSNTAHIDSGDWHSVSSLVDTPLDTDYIVSVVNDGDAGITLYPNISYDGDYSVLLFTPGCAADGSCAKRSIVNVTLLDTDLNVLDTKLIYQNNDGDKFDYLFYGHMNGSSNDDGRNRVKINFHSAIDPGVNDPWMVVDHVTANIVSLDNYQSKNSTNSTRRHEREKHDLQHIYLNGLFEYSLSNFSDFTKDQVSSKVGNETVIKKSNRFVGNSSINELSGKLSKNTTLDQLLLHNSSDTESLLILGNFFLKNVLLPNNNVLQLSINSYNKSLNLSELSISKQKRLDKRENQDIFGVEFDSPISRIENYDSGLMVLGNFSMHASNDDSAEIVDLQNRNKTVDSADNFALYENGKWLSFGNDLFDASFDAFTNLTISHDDYLVFSASDSEYKVYDLSNNKWYERGNLNVSTATLLETQVLLSGEFFNVMDYYGLNEAFIQNNTQVSSYGLNMTDGEVLVSSFKNSTFSVIGGKFDVNLKRSNIAFIHNGSASALSEDLVWDDNAAVSSVYVDTTEDLLFFGTNGSLKSGSDANNTGLVIFDLKKKNLSSVQPADLSTNDNSAIEVNSLALYDASHKLFVGGRFDNAGSLGCSTICIYDIANTRWETPASDDIEGSVYDAKFIDSTHVLLSGNLTVNNTHMDFAVFDFSSEELYEVSQSLALIKVQEDVVRKFTINDESNGDLKSRMTAFGNRFVKGFDGSAWADITHGISITQDTLFEDMKLIQLSNKNHANSNQTYFDSDKILLLSGRFNLTDYGPVSAALFDGNAWIPYVFTLKGATNVGKINSLLFKDAYSFQSSSDIKKGKGNLSKGQVVGVSLACAIGSTAFIGLLYLIPLFFLFKRRDHRGEPVSQRIHEDEMMNVINPEDLFHEIDLQRHQ